MKIEFKHGPRMGPAVYKFRDQEIVTIGRFSYADPSSYLYHYSFLPHLKIGSFTSIAAGCRFFARQNHHVEWVTTYPIEMIAGSEAGTGRHDDLPDSIVIGSDVWMGDSATILPGVTIGDGAVIGANAVVAKDVPPYAVVVGNPGRVRRYRFDDTTIIRLLALRWWDWPIERIQAMAPVIWSSNISDFLAEAEHA